MIREPGILRAISPTYAVTFMFEHGHVAFIALGSVVLTVTGAEALYADMATSAARRSAAPGSSPSSPP